MKTNSSRLHLTVFALAGLMTFAGSCSKNNDCKEHNASECKELPDMTNIRIRNNTQYPICNVTVTPSGTTANYGLLEKNETSCYNNFELAYRYAYTVFEIKGEQYTLQPIDFVGEVPLGVGNFTYTISDIDIINKSFVLKATKD